MDEASEEEERMKFETLMVETGLGLPGVAFVMHGEGYVRIPLFFTN